MNAALKLVLSLFLSCSTTVFASQAFRLSATRVLEELDTPKPVMLLEVPDGSERSLLVLQGGKVLSFDRNLKPAKKKVFLEMSPEKMIDNAFEEGLLGLVFHPDYPKNKCFYLYYTLQNPKRSVLVERKMSDVEKLIPDSNYQRTLLEIRQPYWNHNSGIPVFGPDGYLYLSTGDGGKANDPHDLAQNTFSLLGKILRIDVNQRTGLLQYGIPKDNPFVDKPGFRPEIWTTGMRNPWRLHWDFKSKTLYCADVGQHQKEEINVITKGGNYGWSYMEGVGAFDLKKRLPPEGAQFIEPVFEYDHTQGTSVSGGYVYRGKAHPSLVGYYLFGDWGTGKCWAIKLKDGKVSDQREVLFLSSGELLNPPPVFKNGKPRNSFKPVNFCPLPNGEIAILDWGGVIYSTTSSSK